MPIGIVACIVRDKIPCYLSNVPIPRSLRGFFDLTFDEWIQLVSFSAICGGLLYVTAYPIYVVYYPEFLKEFNQLSKPVKSKRGKVSKLEELDIEDLGSRTKFCRCWKSKSCPSHDASRKPSKRQAALCNDSNTLIMERRIQSERPCSDHSPFDIGHLLPSSPEHNTQFDQKKSIFSSSGHNSTNHNDRTSVRSQSSDASLLALLGTRKTTVSSLRGGSMGEKIPHSKPTVTFEPHPKYAFIAKAESAGSSSHLLTIGDLEQDNFNEHSYNKVTTSTHMEGSLKRPAPFHGNVENFTSVLSPINSPESDAQLRSSGLNRKGHDYKIKNPFSPAAYPVKKLSLLSTITEFSSIDGYDTSRRKVAKPCNEVLSETGAHLKATHVTAHEKSKSDKCSMNSFLFSLEARQGLFQKTEGEQKRPDSDIFSTADEAGPGLFANSITTNQSFYLAKQNPSWLMSSPSKGNLIKTNEVDNLDDRDNDASSVITHYSVFSASKNESSSFMERLYSSTNISEHFSFESDSSVSSLIDGSMSKCTEFMPKSVKPFTEDYCLEQPFLNKTYPRRNTPDGESKPLKYKFFSRDSFSEIDSSEKTSSLLHLDTKVSITTTDSSFNDETFSKSTFSRKKANTKAKTDQLLLNIKNAKYLSGQMGGPHPTASAVTNLYPFADGETTLPSIWKGLKIVSPTSTNQVYKEEINLCSHLDRTDAKLIDYGHCGDVRMSKSFPGGFALKNYSTIYSESNESIPDVSEKRVLQNRCEAAQKLSCSHHSLLPTTFLKSLQLKADSSQYNGDASKDGKRSILVIGGKHIIDYKKIFQKKVSNEMVLPSVNKYIHQGESDTNVSCSSSTNTSVDSVTNLIVSDYDTDSLADNDADDTSSDQTFCKGIHIYPRTSISSLSTLKP